MRRIYWTVCGVFSNRTWAILHGRNRTPAILHRWNRTRPILRKIKVSDTDLPDGVLTYVLQGVRLDGSVEALEQVAVFR